MRLLLDTHVAIWALTDPKKLSEAGQRIIADSENTIYVSAATVWEIAIKHPLNKMPALPFSGSDAIRYFQRAGYVLLDINAAHAAAVEALPKLHGDPFDRLLVAQAFVEALRLVTKDAQVSAYGHRIIQI